jgi:hypothetical protein
VGVFGSRGMHAVITPAGLAKLKEAVPGIAGEIVDNLKADQPSPPAAV